jgi:hypothetical protein
LNLEFEEFEHKIWLWLSTNWLWMSKFKKMGLVIIP